MIPFLAITSVHNPRVQAAKALATRKGRLEQSAFLCEGEHLVLEAVLMCPQAVQAVFVCQEKLALYESLLEPLMRRAKATPTADAVQSPTPPVFYAVTEPVLASLSHVKAPQGIAAVVGLPSTIQTSIDGRPDPLLSLGSRLVLLENVQDPGNVGTVLRTVDAVGLSGCILAGDCADPFAPKTLRATMGSVFRVPMAIVPSGEEAVRKLSQAGYGVIAAVLDGEPFYQRGALPDKFCLLIGNEGAGLTPGIVAQAPHRYALPMRGGAESLNAAVAAAVMMYDLMNR